MYPHLELHSALSRVMVPTNRHVPTFRAVLFFFFESIYVRLGVQNPM